MAALAVYSTEPSARYHHAAVGVGSNMFVWGGDGGDGSVVSSSVVERFNVQSASWGQVRCPSLPDGLRGMAVESDGERAYCVGGFVGRGSQLYNALYVLDLSSMRCRKLSTGAQSPTARAYSNIIHYARTLVLYGGWTGSRMSDELFIFDLDTSEGITLGYIFI